ncbi:MAG: hypothetical protein WBQ23_08190 [Bacteroidota bacterium]
MKQDQGDEPDRKTLFDCRQRYTDVSGEANEGKMPNEELDLIANHLLGWCIRRKARTKRRKVSFNLRGETLPMMVHLEQDKVEKPVCDAEAA